MSKTRSIGLDIIRATAIFLVMITHMLNHTGVLSGDLQSLRWEFFNVVHYISMICVPLFLLLTGYLQSKRSMDKKHYTSIIPVLISYAVISILSMLTVTLYGSYDFNIVNILNYSFGYGWYVEMYISLFLIIPFLNIITNSISRNAHIALILILSFLTMLPSLLKGFNIDALPDFFQNFYVVAYYFIGSFIAKYKPKPSVGITLAAFIFTVAFEAICCHIMSSQAYAWQIFNHNSTITHAIAATAFFLLIYDINIKNKVFCTVVREISVCSFEMYLISYVTDLLFYAYFKLPIWQAVVLNLAAAYITAKIFRLIFIPITGAITTGLQSITFKNTLKTNKKQTEGE